jgi:ATP-dependent exoDNAse (exonuclease V) beta subunit
MEITKQNGNICFAEKEHIYWDQTDPSAKYVSVTTLIHSFTQPFDKEFWSAYKALEKLVDGEMWKMLKKELLQTKRFDKEILSNYDISENDFNKTQQEILDAWQQENFKSCERGTAIHAQLENSMYEMGANVSLKKFGVGGKFVCEKNRNTLDLENGVYPEYLISRESKDGILRIAGQIDLLVKHGNEIIIMDWKTNKKIDLKGGFNTQTKSTTKMKYPLNTLDDCNYMHYALQLSTYAWMIQQLNPKFVIKDLILVHFDHQGNQTVYHLDYLKDEVERMLKFHKKNLIKEIQRAKRVPIEY